MPKKKPKKAGGTPSEGAASRKIYTEHPPPFSAAMAARIINWPVEEWPCNCWAVAEAIRLAGLVPGAKTTYGIYNGPISDASTFSGRSFARHGWLVLADRTIIDPTRWVFLAIKPCIAFIPHGDRRQVDYDMGGSQLRAESRRMVGFDTPPASTLAPTDVPAVKWSKNVARCLTAFYGDPGALTRRQIMWAAGLHPDTWGGSARDFYKTLVEAGLRVLIPIDCRRLVYPEGEDTSPRLP